MGDSRRTGSLGWPLAELDGSALGSAAALGIAAGVEGAAGGATDGTGTPDADAGGGEATGGPAPPHSSTQRPSPRAVDSATRRTYFVPRDMLVRDA